MACGCTIRNVFRRSRAFGHSITIVAALALLIGGLAGPTAAAPSAMPTTVSVSVTGGYARIVFTASQYIDATTRVAGNVLIISFKQPVEVTVDRIAQQAYEYVGAARRDPDGMAVRVALARPLTVNAMSAGEKFFVDLLPDTWKGVPPGLPQDVVDDLARRAREADLILKRERQQAAQKKIAPVRVHVATQPTFTRYVFTIANNTSVSADRSKDRLVLNFDSPLTFDLADAKVALPSAIQELSSELDGDTALVRFIFAGKVDVRTFRDDNGYVVDVVNSDAAADQGGQPPAKVQVASASESAPLAVPAPDPALAMATAAAKIDAAKNAALPIAAAPAPQPAAAAVAAAAETGAPTAPRAAPAVAAVAPQPASASSQAAAAAQPAPTPPPSAPMTRSMAQPGETRQTPVETAKAATAAPPAAADMPVMAAAATVEAKPVAAPPAAAAAQSAPAPDAAKPRAAPSGGKIAVELQRDGPMLKLSFPFAAPVGAAVFRRADALWLVFDSNADFDLTALDGEPSHTIRGYDVTRTYDAGIVRLRLNRPQLASVSANGPVWTVNIGESVVDPTRGLEISRNMVGPNRASVSIPFEEPQQLHRIVDPDAGDNLVVATALPPARGFINEQDFIEFRALASTQGVVIEPLADDVDVELAPDKVVVSRPSGLTLSTAQPVSRLGNAVGDVRFADLGQRPRVVVLGSTIESHCRRRRRAREQALRAAARSGALLSRP